MGRTCTRDANDTSVSRLGLSRFISANDRGGLVNDGRRFAGSLVGIITGG